MLYMNPHHCFLHSMSRCHEWRKLEHRQSAPSAVESSIYSKMIYIYIYGISVTERMEERPECWNNLSGWLEKDPIA